MIENNRALSTAIRWRPGDFRTGDYGPKDAPSRIHGVDVVAAHPPGISATADPARTSTARVDNFVDKPVSFAAKARICRAANTLLNV
jgi:hypothetical protein